MKARLLWLVAVLVLGGVVGLVVTSDPGYVLVAYDRMAIETSLWFGLLLLVVGYVLVRIVHVVVAKLARGRGALSGWNTDRRRRAADQGTQRGLALMASGQWAEARKQLTGAAPQAAAPVVNLLTAAWAAQHSGDRTGRDGLLRDARARAPESEAAIDFTEAKLELSAEQWPEARATLERLRDRQPAHMEVVWMLADCLRRQADWQALSELLPVLKRDRGRPAEALAALERAAALGRLETGAENPVRVWEALSKAQRQSAELALAFARATTDKHPDDAERAVRESLKNGWDSGLVEWYGRIGSSDPARQLTTAESWLKAHPDDAMLLLTLGRLCLRNRRWPQAREYFEVSVRLGPTQESQGELGRLCAALGEARAVELLIEALPMLPALPLPAGVIGSA